MKRRRLISLLAILLATVFLLSACSGPAAQTPAADTPGAADPGAPAPEPEAPAPAPSAGVELTMGSWRADDVDQMEALFAHYLAVSGVQINFLPINPPDYNAWLRLQLDSGTGPDLMFTRSFATGLDLYESGFLTDISSVPGVMENFSEGARSPWSSTDGVPYALPFVAVSHAVYYNKDIFAANNLSIPTTFDEFVDLCQNLLDLGYIPLANGIADEWDILEVLFLNMLPNYVGGAAERAKYESGELKLNDDNFVAAYKDLARLAPFLPVGFEAVTYNDSQALFRTQSAAMFPDGSWNISAYDGVDFDWGLFSIPPPAGRPGMVTFHSDAGLSINTASPNIQAAEDFMAWLCTAEGAAVAANLMPTGFFPMIDLPITLEDQHANEFLQLNTGKELDVRFIWPYLIDLYTPMLHEINSLLTGTQTPQGAADAVTEAAAPLVG